MHELSVMTQLVSSLLDELDDKDIKNVSEVDIEIGELTFLGDEQLKFAYETLSKETILEGSELNIRKLSSKINCENCGYEGGVNYSDDPAFHYEVPVISCPECDSKPTIVQGKETKIVSVRVKEE